MNVLRSMFGICSSSAEKGEVHDTIRRVFGNEMVMKDNTDKHNQYETTFWFCFNLFLFSEIIKDTIYLNFYFLPDSSSWGTGLAYWNKHFLFTHETDLALIKISEIFQTYISLLE